MVKLYKYTTFDSAKKILENKSFRFSSPMAFNDPFDMHMASVFGYDKNQFAKDYVDIFLVETERIRRTSALPQDILQLRDIIEKLDAHVTGKEQFANVLATSDTNGFKKEENEYYTLIKPICDGYGVFCTSSKNDNILMWSHYTNCHQGVAFEITACDEQSIFLKSKPVNYSNDRPTIYKTPKDLIEIQCMNEPNGIASKLMNELTYSKSELWTYESEYRLAFSNLIEKGNTFKDVPFTPKEISAVFLGCRMNPASQKEIIEMAGKLNDSIKVFRGIQHVNSYELYFDEVR